MLGICLAYTKRINLYPFKRLKFYIKTIFVYIGHMPYIYTLGYLQFKINNYTFSILLTEV
jgi:hypothetical protein